MVLVVGTDQRFLFEICRLPIKVIDASCFAIPGLGQEGVSGMREGLKYRSNGIGCRVLPRM